MAAGIDANSSSSFVTNCREQDLICDKYKNVLKSVHKSMKGFEASNTLFKGSVIAHRDIELTSCKVENNIESSMGKVALFDTKTHGTVKSHTNVTLHRSVTGSVESSMGGVHIDNKGLFTDDVTTSIKAHQSVNLKHVKAEEVSSRMSSVQATNSDIDTISTVKQLDLNENSLVKTVLIEALKSKETYQAVINLDDSKITGSIIVKVNKNTYSSQKTFHQGAGKFFHIEMSGTHYPLSPAIAIIVKMSGVEVSHDGRILNTHGKRIKIGAHEFGVEDEKDDTAIKCTLTIKGTGEVTSSIKFEGCSGVILRSDHVSITAPRDGSLTKRAK